MEMILFMVIQEAISFTAGGGNSLYGGDGNDHLFGGSGNDILKGSSGMDFFECNEGIDTVLDFNSKEDTMNLNCENI